MRKEVFVQKFSKYTFLIFVSYSYSLDNITYFAKDKYIHFYAM